ncbi:aminoacyl-tRNA deacylase [candidate division KSB1 bacterium]
MAVCSKLIQFLDDNHARYTVASFSKAYTSQETAAALQVSGKELAKSIIVQDNGNFSLLILPSNFRVDFDQLKSTLGNKNIRLASEKYFKSLFPDCEIGAMCPFGHLYKIPVYIAQSISDQEEIVFKAGTHSDAVRMSMDDYIRLEAPKALHISEPIWPVRNSR